MKLTRSSVAALATLAPLTHGVQAQANRTTFSLLHSSNLPTDTPSFLSSITNPPTSSTSLLPQSTTVMPSTAAPSAVVYKPANTTMESFSKGITDVHTMSTKYDITANGSIFEVAPTWTYSQIREDKPATLTTNTPLATMVYPHTYSIPGDVSLVKKSDGRVDTTTGTSKTFTDMYTATTPATAGKPVPTSGSSPRLKVPSLFSPITLMLHWAGF